LKRCINTAIRDYDDFPLRGLVLKRVLIISDAGAQSINLQSTDSLIFYNIPAGVGRTIQALGRIARKYSEYSTFNFYFIGCEETIDQYKMHYVESNEGILRNLFNNKIIPIPPVSMNEYLKIVYKRKMLWSRKR
jgi:hypothetical protein